MNRAATDSGRSSVTAHDRTIGAPILSADSIKGGEVCNLKEEKLGTIQDIMLDMQSGRIRYAVLSSGGFLGMGDRLFAVPWSAIKLDPEHERFILDVAVERLEAAPGFDKDDWPDMADSAWGSTVESYYEKRS